MKKQFQVEDWLKFLRLPYEAGGQNEIKTTCWACGKEKHLFINTTDHNWICFKCGEAGGESRLKRTLLTIVAENASHHGIEYFEARGLTPATIEARQLGYYEPLERYTIPYYNGDGIYNIAFRASKDDQDPKYLRLPHVDNKPFILGPKEAQVVVFTEGEIDAISTAQAYPDALVVGLPGASFVNDALSAAIPAGSRLVAILDDDAAGKAATKKLRKRFPGVRVSIPGSGVKDLNDLLIKHGEQAVRDRITDVLNNGGDSVAEDSEDRTSTGAKPLRATAYLRLPDEHGAWLVEDMWVDRSLGFVAGVPKSMKSMLTLHLAYHVATGTPFVGKRIIHPGPVLLVQEEDNDLTIKNRLRSIDQTGTENLWLWTFGSVGSHVRLDSEDSVEALDDAIREIQPVLVILDPLANMHMLENENDAASINRVMERLRYIRDLRKCSIMVVHHMRKEGNTAESRHWGQRMRGSSVLHAKSESALYVEKWGDMLRINIETKMAQGRVLEIRWTNNGFVFQDEHGAGVGDDGNDEQ
jgi:hypothetical protein